VVGRRSESNDVMGIIDLGGGDISLSMEATVGERK
jgi:hypothetical protein